jgi:hypothetical protein
MTLTRTTTTTTTSSWANQTVPAVGQMGHRHTHQPMAGGGARRPRTDEPRRIGRADHARRVAQPAGDLLEAPRRTEYGVATDSKIWRVWLDERRQLVPSLAR